MAFASADDVATRLGETPLSEADQAAASQLLDFATAVLTDAVDKSTGWADELDPVPEVLKGLAVELVCRAMASPQGLAAASETLGAYTREETYRRDLSTAMALTPVEERIARSAVYGSSSGSSSPESLVDRIVELREGEEPE
jgi:hypothetical protein